MLGDLPDDNMTELLSSKYKLEYFTDAKCFTYDSATDWVVYQPSYEEFTTPREML